MKSEKEHIQTARMLQVIREFNDSKTSKDNTKESIAITNEPRFGNNVLKMQEDSLQNAVSSGVKFPGDSPLVYFPEDGNLVFSGEIPSMNLKFQYSKNSSEGCPFVWLQGSPLNPENLKILNKLYGYYMNWKEQWEKESGTLENLKK